MASNGRLSASALAPIPGGHLEKHAAVYWNALVAEARRRFGVVLRPEGPLGSYRTFAQQVYLWHLYLTGRGNLAARPGTSNHGLGLAIDLADKHMRWIIDRIGYKYGFSKRCSDAQSEWWHIKWNPHCTHASWRPPHAKPLPVLHRGARGPTVVKLQRLLRKRGHHLKITGHYDNQTIRVIKRVQKRAHLRPVDGVCGPRTWHAVLGGR